MPGKIEPSSRARIAGPWSPIRGSTTADACGNGGIEVDPDAVTRSFGEPALADGQSQATDPARTSRALEREAGPGAAATAAVAAVPDPAAAPTAPRPATRGRT